MAILLKGWFWPIVGVASRRVCAQPAKQTFYHGLLPVRQSAPCFLGGYLNSGEVGFGGPWVSTISALV